MAPVTYLPCIIWVWYQSSHLTSLETGNMLISQNIKLLLLKFHAHSHISVEFIKEFKKCITRATLSMPQTQRQMYLKKRKLKKETTETYRKRMSMSMVPSFFLNKGWLGMSWQKVEFEQKHKPHLEESHRMLMVYMWCPSLWLFPPLRHKPKAHNIRIV